MGNTTADTFFALPLSLFTDQTNKVILWSVKSESESGRTVADGLSCARRRIEHRTHPRGARVGAKVLGKVFFYISKKNYSP